MINHVSRWIQNTVRSFTHSDSSPQPTPPRRITLTTTLLTNGSMGFLLDFIVSADCWERQEYRLTFTLLLSAHWYFLWLLNAVGSVVLWSLLHIPHRFFTFPTCFGIFGTFLLSLHFFTVGLILTFHQLTQSTYITIFFFFLEKHLCRAQSVSGQRWRIDVYKAHQESHLLLVFSK